MNNDEFRELWDVLNGIYAKRSPGMSLADLNHGGKIMFARKIKAELDDWCDQVVARAKGEFENEKRNFDNLRAEVGDRFDTIETDYVHGLIFPTATADKGR